MMKRHLKYLLGGLLVVAASACSEEELMQPMENPVTTQGEIVTVNAYVPDDGAPMTRVALTPGGTDEAPTVSVAWAEGDEFIVYRGGEVQTFTKAEGENTFTGTLPTAGEGNYYAAYAGGNIDDGTAIVSVMQEQTGKLESIKTCMYAVSEDGKNFRFKHLTALLKPTFVGIPEGHTVNRVEILSDVATEYEYNLITGAVNDLYYTIGPIKSHPTYIYLPPMAEGKKLEFVVTTKEGGGYVAVLTTRKPIEAGKLYTTTINLGEPTRTAWQPGIGSIPPAGEGTEESPYLIANAYNLDWLRRNSGYSPYNTCQYRLTADNLTINGEWEPSSGAPSSAFEGTFDGNGKTISGTLEFNLDYQYTCGLFGCNKGTIKNLTIDMDVTGGTSGTDDGKIGSVVGYNMEGGQVIDCINKGSVKGVYHHPNSKISHVGGIVGYNVGTVTGCTNEGEVTGVPQDEATSGTKSYAGGIVGYNRGTVTDCTNTGAVNGNSANTTSTAGGIAGWVYSGTFDRCTNSGTVTGYSSTTSNPSDNYVGGIIGTKYSSASEFTVLGCVNHGAVTGGTGNESRTGGLIGYCYGGTTLVACANTGALTVGAAETDGLGSVGVIVGYGSVTEVGVWVAGDTYADKANGYYTLAKGDTDNTNNAISAMNTEIASWKTKITPIGNIHGNGAMMAGR